MSDDVTVIQADREAAADAVMAIRGRKNGDWQGRIRRGECDDGVMVQAFAKYRLSTPSPDSGERMRVALGAAVQLEINEGHGWSLKFLFGPGVSGREKMRAASAYIRGLRAAPAALQESAR